MNDRRAVPFLFLGCVVLYSLTNYGGIRSPDAEVVFRAGQSLAEGRGFTVEQIEEYSGFGVAPGKDGKLYAIYPPLQSLALAPWIALSAAIGDTGWYEGLELPASHYVDRGLETVLFGRSVGRPEVHALRFPVSFFNVLVSALCAVVFFRIAVRMLDCAASALATSLLFAFATLAWPYSGTMFTEPLATLLVLYSFYKLLARDRRFGEVPAGSGAPALVVAGLALGLAAATHVTALLFLPFFLYYGWWVGGGRQDRRGALQAALAWLAGFAAVLAALGWYNAARFGSPFEGGRALSAMNPVVFLPPGTDAFWHGLYGLLLGGGKGLLVFCPAVVLALLGWPAFARGHGRLAALLGAAVLARVLFVASYYDWHGGFCLGPRYLLMAVPFLVLPFGFWWRNRLRERRWTMIAVSAAVAWSLAAQQFYFALGEIFRYLHTVKLEALRDGVDVLAGNRIYLDWSLSPALHLLDQPRGAFLLGWIPLSGPTLWAVGAGALFVLVAGGYALLRRRAVRAGASG